MINNNRNRQIMIYLMSMPTKNSRKINRERIIGILTQLNRILQGLFKEWQTRRENKARNKVKRKQKVRKIKNYKFIPGLKDNSNRHKDSKINRAYNLDPIFHLLGEIRIRPYFLINQVNLNNKMISSASFNLKVSQKNKNNMIDLPTRINYSKDTSIIKIFNYKSRRLSLQLSKSYNTSQINQKRYIQANYQIK